MSGSNPARTGLVWLGRLDIHRRAGTLIVLFTTFVATQSAGSSGASGSCGNGRD
jgi:hypothetical protein